MAISVPAPPSIDADTAQGIAADYLIDYVGNLLEAGPPQLMEDGCWLMPVILSSSRRGRIGQVGTIAVDAESGQILFSDEDRVKVKASARLLAGASSP